MSAERRLRVNIGLSCRTPADIVDKLLFLLQGPLRNYSHKIEPDDNGDWACDVPTDESLGVALSIRSIPMCEVDMENMMRHAGCNEDTIQNYLRQKRDRDEQGEAEGQPTS